MAIRYARGAEGRWCTAVFGVLLCSVAAAVMAGGESRLLPRDVYVSQLERSAVEESSRRPFCPNCLTDTEIKAETDKLRLDAIKKQILSKLGLRQKPNVTHSLPRDVIMETLSRAEDNSDFFSNFRDSDDINTSTTTSQRTTVTDAMDFDDFYGRTSEIISFAEKGS